jgi:hypothetical protein
MGPGQLNAWITQFKQLMTPDTVDALGRDMGLCQRRRQITPWRLAVSLLSAFATRSLDSLADLQREYNALFDTAVAYKPFHKPLAKPSFADFMRVLAGQLLDQLRVQVLQAQPDDGLDGFNRVVIQDGSSFALRDDLAGVYPGRFNQYKPAAVELQTTLELFDGMPSQLTLTPDTAPERDHLPAPEALSGSLLLADRGYCKWADLNRLNQNDASFVIRAYASINPSIIRAFDSTGKRRARLEERQLKQAYRAPRRLLDLDVYRPQRHPSDVVRLIVNGQPNQKSPFIIVTNLDRLRYSADTVLRLYQLRWKEYKSHADLHAFRTANPDIAEGLIWAAVAAATLQRFMGHLTQRVHALDISSQRVAKAASAALADLFKALAADRADRIRRAFKATLAYLAINAKRAHPRRDRRTGRLQTGLESTGGVA